jgi:hypothetical protein
VKSWTIVVAANCKVKTLPTEVDVSLDSNPPRLVVLSADFERIGAKADASMPIPMESLAGKIADILAGEPT